MYQRGDRVVVRGYGGRTAVLRVVETRRRGLLLCPESRFGEIVAGREPVAVGFPYSDVVGLADDSSGEMAGDGARQPGFQEA